MRADPLGQIGRWEIRTAALAGRIVGLAYLANKAVILEGGRGLRLVTRTFLLQVHFTAGQAIPLLSAVSLSTGAIVFVLTTSLLGKIGAWDRIPVFAEALLLELVPVITVLVIIGRSGTAMATEIGTMKVNREDEVLDSLAINLHYLVVFPRLLGMVVSVLLLNLYDFALARIGGEWIGRRLGLVYTEGAVPSLLETMGAWNLSGLALKSVLFGAAIALLTCHYGLAVGRAPNEIPKGATRAVIASIFVCLMIDLAVVLLVTGGPLV